MSMLASVSESVRAIRFRSAPRLQEVFLLPLGHPSAVWVEPDAPHAALMVLPRFLQLRDLQHHPTKRCSPHLLTPGLPRSSESVPRSEQHVRARLVLRCAKNGQGHDTNYTNCHEPPDPFVWIREIRVSLRLGSGSNADFGDSRPLHGVHQPD